MHAMMLLWDILRLHRQLEDMHQPPPCTTLRCLVLSKSNLLGFHLLHNFMRLSTEMDVALVLKAAYDSLHCIIQLTRTHGHPLHVNAHALSGASNQAFGPAILEGDYAEGMVGTTLLALFLHIAVLQAPAAG